MFSTFLEAKITPDRVIFAIFDVAKIPVYDAEYVI